MRSKPTKVYPERGAVIESASAAELALKAYSVASSPDDFPHLFEREQSPVSLIDQAVSMTEAPEDAVCSLVIDLMRYCQREHIDWTKEIIPRVRGIRGDKVWSNS